MITLGIVSDTHVPDRSARIQSEVVEIFRRARVDFILHAGDVCISSVITDLEEIAPVYAVLGNRDWPALRSLPMLRCLEFGGVQIGLLHGHGGLLHYAIDKGRTALLGLKLDLYLRRALATFPHAQVIVFGHTHIPINHWVDGRLAFNPGSACCPEKKVPSPSVGLIRIQDDKTVAGEIVPFPE